MSQVSLDPVHALEISTATLPLLVPSACVAEVIGVQSLTRIPHSPRWVLGMLGWRGKPVPVVSMDALLRNSVRPAGDRSRLVVFYPLPGRNAWEFFAILAASEPQSRTIDSSILATSVDLPDNSYIATAVKFGKSVAAIPDFDALKEAFYPG
jgi:chemosensory pili system protein ChpC